MKKRSLSLFFYISAGIFTIALISLALARMNFAAAEFLNMKLGAFFRGTLLPVSNFIQFSLFEFLLVLSPVFLVFALILLVRVSSKQRKRRFFNLVSLFLLFLSLYIFTVGIGFNQSPDISEVSASEEELVSALEYLKNRVSEDYSQEYPDINLLGEIFYKSYSKMENQQLSVTSAVPRPKPLKNSKIASRLRILASYSFLTSEINVNTEAPEYTVPFSVAHEMAHLFGASDEGEANFFAYLAGTASENGAVIYSVSLNAFEYLGAELGRINPRRYAEIYASLSPRAVSDIKSYRDFYTQNSGAAADASDKANGALLDAFDKHGKNSYDRFSILLIEYFKSINVL